MFLRRLSDSSDEGWLAQQAKHAERVEQNAKAYAEAVAVFRAALAAWESVCACTDQGGRGAYRPTRAGCASPLMKLQRATLAHFTIWLDYTGRSATRSVAVSMVEGCAVNQFHRGRLRAGALRSAVGVGPWFNSRLVLLR